MMTGYTIAGSILDVLLELAGETPAGEDPAGVFVAVAVAPAPANVIMPKLTKVEEA